MQLFVYSSLHIGPMLTMVFVLRIHPFSTFKNLVHILNHALIFKNCFSESGTI